MPNTKDEKLIWAFRLFLYLQYVIDVSYCKIYVEKVMAAGFNIDAETNDESVFGMTIYSYTAKNAAGYTITVGFAVAASTIVITKP